MMQELIFPHSAGRVNVPAVLPTDAPEVHRISSCDYRSVRYQDCFAAFLQLSGKKIAVIVELDFARFGKMHAYV
ncbi:hypothetical protein CA13_72960 [Planctomycetes bacterium CA13]|uniref:Uncharacterized protein n=1 Tax=Novipirellula herctigrandis TaxID=2527986 RepID=A0A5C5YPU2_9BACT|nr:hypothetical protein CA13_72960 [Planctomycetes bacterium CA13]